jgi:tricorn protease
MPQGYYRNPTIYKNTVVFVCEDDLWVTHFREKDDGLIGTPPRRLTSGVSEASMPSLSPDGKHIAFIGREEGEEEVYVMPAEGGPARRLTYFGMNSLMVGWTVDGHIIFASDAGQPFSGQYWLHSIDPDKPVQIERINAGPARTIALAPHSGDAILGRNTGDPARWKRYRGGQVGQLWRISSKTENITPLITLDSNLASPMWLKNNRIYFISDHEGIGNLYSCTPNGKGLQRHTDHRDFYVRNAQTDGERIVYHAGADLFVLEVIESKDAVNSPKSRKKIKPRRLEFEFYSPQTQRNRKFVDASFHLGDYALSPNGNQLTITTRGKLFSMWCFEGAATQHGERDVLPPNTQNTAVRHRLPTFIANSEIILAISDEGGEESFVGYPRDPRTWLNKQNIADIHKANEMARKLDIGRVTTVKANPKRGQVAFTNHRYELMVLDFEGEAMKLTTVDRGKARPIEGFDWSPDGAWLAYGCSISLQKTAIKLWKAESGETMQITNPVLRDAQPSFDPAGKYLYFLSRRLYDPVYDNMHFELSFPNGMLPCLIPLSANTPSPFIPQPPDERSEDENKPKSATETQPTASAENTPSHEPVNSDAGGVDTASDAEPIEIDPDATTVSQDSAVASENTLGVDDSNKKIETQPALEIDLEGIESRVIAFPVSPGIYKSIAGIKGKKVLYTFDYPDSALNNTWAGDDDTSGAELEFYDLEERREDTLASNVSGFAVTPDGGTVIYKSGYNLRVFKAGEKPDDNATSPRKRGWIDLSRVRVSVNPPAEWRQMFREAWRLQRDNYWTPDMSNIDWLAVHDRYLPLVDRVSSRSEFTDLMWEMQGELGTSHAYVGGGDYRWLLSNYSQGYLGADYEWDENLNAWRISNIVRGDSWDPKTDSPLAGAGVNVKAGDILVEINGQALSRDISPEMCLVNQAGNDVTLVIGDGAQVQQAQTLVLSTDVNNDTATITIVPDVPEISAETTPPQTPALDITVSRDDAQESHVNLEKYDEASNQTDATTTPELESARLTEETTDQPEPSVPYRVVMIKTLRNDRGARYRSWVEANRKWVHEQTQGRCGYIHIPDMGPHGYAEFHRGYLAEIERDALIIDVRHNGGGNVSQLILEKLSRRRLGYDVSRWGQIPEPYPLYSIAGPLVAITNEHAVSDGDMFSHAFKMMKLGPLIGTRTWGGVIGIAGYRWLSDGGGVSQPEFAGWFHDVGWRIENYGAEPDILVDNTPLDWMSGTDAQLTRGISEINRLLISNPLVAPTFGERPNLALPRLREIR